MNAGGSCLWRWNEEEEGRRRWVGGWMGVVYRETNERIATKENQPSSTQSFKPKVCFRLLFCSLLFLSN